MAKNRTCFICGNKYDYCPTCDRDRLKPSWYALFCNDNCYKINNILSANTAGKLSVLEAQVELKKINFEDSNIKNELTKSHIDKIMKHKEKTVDKEKVEKK